MHGLNFVNDYDGRRIEREQISTPFYAPEDEGEEDDTSSTNVVNTDIEMALEDWEIINPQLPESWRSQDWQNRPVRFVDGKDVGQTVAWLRGTDGSFVAMRLAEIGSVVMKNVEGELRREFAQVQRVLAMNTSVFPWEEIESFALGLREHDIYLLPTSKTPADSEVNFEEIRQLAQRRTAQEMNVLEEHAISRYNDLPMIVDGNLKSHEGGFDIINSPVFGVVKKPKKLHLNRRGLETMFSLKEGQRTPAFSFFSSTTKSGEQLTNYFPVIAWYLRLCSGDGIEPNVGLVRVEVSQKWFSNMGYGDTQINEAGKEFMNQLTRTVYEYRCRQKSYRRMKISLEPIVRAEESLGSLFCQSQTLKNKFYRLTNL